MSVFCGIDEAGYGPLLGPLVVTAAAFRCPAVASPAAFAEACRSVFAAEVDGRCRRFVVADSKRLHQGPRRRQRLEAALLPFLAIGRRVPGDWRELLAQYGGDERLAAEHQDYPWYREAALPLPRTRHGGDVEGGGDLAAALQTAGMAFLGFRTNVVHVARFNRDVARHDNKGAALLEYTLGLALAAMRAWPDEPVFLTIDRQGGRAYYAPALQAAFADSLVTVLHEDRRRSAYRLRQGGRLVEISFTVGADAGQPAVSLASMFSKYVRELCMEAFCGFWAARRPGLKPTAGYYADGRRFLREIEPLRAALGIDPDRLVRCR